MSGQSQWWSVILLILTIEPSEFLHALAGIHLGSEDISLSVDSDVVQRRELANLAAGPTEPTERSFEAWSTMCTSHSSHRSCR
jgi:hypothetical protein